MSLLPKSIHRCRRYPTKFNSGRDIPELRNRIVKRRFCPLCRSLAERLGVRSRARCDAQKGRRRD